MDNKAFLIWNFWLIETCFILIFFRFRDLRPIEKNKFKLSFNKLTLFNVEMKRRKQDFVENSLFQYLMLSFVIMLFHGTFLSQMQKE
jgi:hypothetical protein